MKIATTAHPALHLWLHKVAGRSPLSAEARAAVLSLPAMPRRAEAHRDIVHLGQSVGHACLVADGFVARYEQTQDGKRQFVAFHLPGDMPDLHSLMLPAAPSPLVALTPTIVLQVPHAALRDAISRHPELATALWRECVVDGQVMAEWLLNVGRRDSRGRLAHLLCEMALRNGQIGAMRRGTFPFPVTQEHIADALGLTAVHVNRSLRALREEGLIQLSRSEARILDWHGLTQAGEFDPGYLHLSAEADGRAQLAS